MARDLTGKPLADLYEVLDVALMTLDALEVLPDCEARDVHAWNTDVIVQAYVSEIERRSAMARAFAEG